MGRQSLGVGLMLALAVTVASGCASTSSHLRSIDMHKSFASYAAKPAPGAPRDSGDAVHVFVLSSPSMGCFFANNAETCIGLAATEQEAALQELKTELKRRGVESGGVVYTGLAAVTAELLRARLAPRFQHVKVSVGTSAPPDAIVVTLELDHRGTTSRVTLRRRTSTGSLLDASGQSTHTASKAHFAWVIPIYLATFPSSLLWMGPATSPIWNRAERYRLVEAMDHAALDLANQLAAQPVQNGDAVVAAAPLDGTGAAP